MKARVLAVGGILALVAGLAPTASACHASGTAQTGAVVEDGAVRQAEILFDLSACEGAVDVTVDVQGEAPETVQAELDVQQPSIDCLPWDVCSPSVPPTATFTLEGDGLSLQGAMHNNLHTTEVTDLGGTYRSNPASFEIVKPI